jgi:hypothetical protein
MWKRLTSQGDKLAVLLRRLIHERRQSLHLRLHREWVNINNSSPGAKEPRLAPSDQVDPRGLGEDRTASKGALTTCTSLSAVWSSVKDKVEGGGRRDSAASPICNTASVDGAPSARTSGLLGRTWSLAALDWRSFLGAERPPSSGVSPSTSGATTSTPWASVDPTPADPSSATGGTASEPVSAPATPPRPTLAKG